MQLEQLETKLFNTSRIGHLIIIYLSIKWDHVLKFTLCYFNIDNN